jgi:hypothetical protein
MSLPGEAAAAPAARTMGAPKESESSGS